ncbi:MAG: caspase family protein [Thermodesulfobacteriota bacterium]
MVQKQNIINRPLRRSPSPILMVLFCVLFFLQPAHSKTNNVAGSVDGEPRHALVIGNGKYKNAPLKNPENDAGDIAAALKMNGFQVKLLNNASQRQMGDAIRLFTKNLQKGGVGLFYYAGHGLQVGGTNYLVPVDARIETETDVRYNAIPAGLILGKMEDAGNSMNIVILDACRNNPYSRGFRSAETGLARMDAPTGSIIAYATAPGSVAADGSGRNGIYTKSLLKHINEPGLTIEQVFKRVTQSVVDESGRKQVPWVSSSFFGNFYFVDELHIMQEAEKSSVKAVQPTAVHSSQVELVFWQSIQDSNDPAMYKAYLDQYPKGDFVKIARLKLVGVQPASKTVRLEKGGNSDEKKSVGVKKGDKKVFQNNYTEKIATGRVTVSASPDDSRVRILNISPRYRPGIKLLPGQYHLEVSRSGYQTAKKWIALKKGDHLTVEIRLKKEMRPEPVPAVKKTSKSKDRFIVYDNGTVKDHKTGLLWAVRDNGHQVDWKGAKRYCENYRGGGYSDWRVPTHDELMELYRAGIKNKSGKNNSVINVPYFAWASETYRSEFAYFDFRLGMRAWTPMNYTSRPHVLPVRNAP